MAVDKKKNTHKKGITYDSIMADSTMTGQDKRTIIRALGLSKAKKVRSDPKSTQATAAHVRRQEGRAKNTRSSGKYKARKERAARIVGAKSDPHRKNKDK